MKLLEIDHSIEVCEKSLTAGNSFGSELEYYLTRYLLILISACFEREIKRIVVESATSRPCDEKLRNYLEQSFDLVFRSVQVDSIKRALSLFGPSCKDRFVESITADKKNARACTYYNNLILNRHETAHVRGSAMTFRELVDSYNQAHVILDLIAESLV
jgi:hypothetical protein